MRNEDFFDGLRQTLTETVEVVGKKTEDLVEVQKLRNKLRNVQRDMDQDYRKLGKLIYHRFVNGEVMDEELAAVCDEIMKLQSVAAGHKEEMANRKGQNICPACGSSNPKDAAFCMYCGAGVQKEEEDEEVFTAGPVKEQTEAEAQKEVWEACTEEEEAEAASDEAEENC